MSKTTKIHVEDKIISVIKKDQQDYIYLTDVVREENGNDHI